MKDELCLRFLETTSYFTWSEVLDEDVQHLALKIGSCGCDEYENDPEELDYIGEIKRIGIRLIACENHLGEHIAGKDDGEWRDGETDEEFELYDNRRQFCQQADIALRTHEPGDYWDRYYGGSLWLQGDEYAYDGTIANCPMYFASAALALIAFEPIAEMEIWDTEYQTVVLTGAPVVCRIGHGSWDKRDAERIASIMKKGKLIRVETDRKGDIREDYPDWVVAMNQGLQPE